MNEGEQALANIRKLSRLEREKEKIKIAQANIDKILAAQAEKQDKQNTHKKIILGVVLQGMISDGVISSELFNRSLEKYLTREKDRQLCDVYFDEHRPKP
jgi:hypothetical protein